METINAIISFVTGLITKALSYIAICAYDYKVIMTIILVLSLLFWRVVIANTLVIKRHDKQEWIIFGGLIVLVVINFFVNWREVWLASWLVIAVAPWVYRYFVSKCKAAIDIIKGGNVLYKGEDENQDDQKVKVGYTTKKRHFILGVPVVGMTFKFKKSATAKEEFSRVNGDLNRYYPAYDFSYIPKGEKMEYIADIQTGKAPIVPFDKKLSDSLPWYCIPLGCVDFSNKVAAKKTAYIWQVNEDHKMATRKDLIDAKIDPNAAPHGLIVGSSGGGKSVLLCSIIAHLINKNNVELTLIDPKKVEFGLYEGLKEVKRLAKSLDEAVEVFDEFVIEMNARYSLMDKLNVRKIPLDGKVDIKDTIMLSSYVFRPNEPITIRLDGTNDEKTIKASTLEKFVGRELEFFVPGDPEKESSQDVWVKGDWDRFQNGGIAEFKPYVLICDEYAELIDDKPRSEYKKVEAVQQAVQSIARLGRAADIHIILATQSSNSSLIPANLRNNIKFRNICGRVDASISHMAIGTEEGENIPKMKGSYLGNIDGDSIQYHGYFADEKDVIAMSAGYRPGMEPKNDDEDDYNDYDDIEDFDESFEDNNEIIEDNYDESIIQNKIKEEPISERPSNLNLYAKNEDKSMAATIAKLRAMNIIPEEQDNNQQNNEDDDPFKDIRQPNTSLKLQLNGKDTSNKSPNVGIKLKLNMNKPKPIEKKNQDYMDIVTL